VAAISAIMQPELRRRKYDVDFSAAVIACAGSLAQIIPPSLMMVVVALVSNLSVGAMFLAGVLPGLLTVPGLLASAYLHARRGGPQYREVEPFTVSRLVRTFWAAIPALGMPVIIIGGIIGGVFTPTEAAAVAVLYGLLIAMFVYRDLTLRELPGLILRAAALSAAVMTIIGTASIFGWLVASANVPAHLAAWIRTVSEQPWTFLILVNVLLMLIGMFMESLAAILILVPVLMPIAIDFGINPVHFGLIVVMNFAIGMVTPPYGITLFVASSVAERSIIQVSRRIFWPWLMMTVILILVTFVPEIGLFLPRLAGLL
jgi:C4-dicarboxylate transporter DctM subunit